MIGDAEVGGQGIETGTEDAKVLEKAHNGGEEERRWGYFNHNSDAEILKPV